MTRERLRPTVLAGWLIAALVLTLVSAPAIAHLWFPDPDDAMRLLEVRDWLSGQSWWDVGQHRLNGGSFPMHWSRLVDLPLAAVMLVFDPIVGTAASTRIALTLVPLVTLLAVMALGAELTRRLSDIARARMAVLLVPLSVPLLYQLRPMRIDHHGWQVALALAAAVALVGRPTARAGAVIGAALATLLTISLEGMPITAAIVGMAMLAWAIDPDRRAQVLAMLWTLLFGVGIFHMATRGPGMFAPACDAIAPGWIAALAVAVLGLSGAVALGPVRLWQRIALLGLAGAAALATLATMTPQCLRGPFATLDPIVFNLWYEKVSEGLPIWQQVPSWALITISFPIAGLVGAALALRAASGPARGRWAMMLGLAAASFALSLLVMRTGATANALALPGGAWLLHRLLTRARAVPPLLLRTAATAVALLTATPGVAVGAVVSLAIAAGVGQHASGSGAGGAGRAIPQCTQGREIGDLGILPASVMFAPIDVSPALIARTHHRAIAGGYHRNAGAMHRVITTFLADPETARRSILASGAGYVVGCPGDNETELFKAVAPNGFWARLERGDRFDWLEPVPLAGSPVLAWRVIGPPHKTLATPAAGS